MQYPESTGRQLPGAVAYTVFARTLPSHEVVGEVCPQPKRTLADEYIMLPTSEQVPCTGTISASRRACPSSWSRARAANVPVVTVELVRALYALALVLILVGFSSMLTLYMAAALSQ